MFSLLCIDKRSVLLKWILYCKVKNYMFFQIGQPQAVGTRIKW